MRVKICRTNSSTEILDNVQEVKREEHGVLIIKEHIEELFFPYVNLSFYLVAKE